MLTRRRVQLGLGLGLLALALAIGALVAWGPDPTALDRWWNGLIAETRAPWLVAVAHGLDRVGGGVIGVWIAPVLIAAAVTALRGWRTGVFAIAAFAFSAGLVQILKHLFARARPEDLMVTSDFGSFPSGHTANAATIAVVLWLLFPRVAVLVAGIAWTVLMGFSRTVVAAHWTTDTLAGAVLGVAAALLCGAALLAWSRPRAPGERRAEGSG
ncbi:phosphatase PAP2 family protein [Gulosibacter sp. 10]|uniref:phosphatase PAP2 family protein n=1 Tax=Gulosibacter sp. 10 TaxID=1255570 RepID=UPI0020CF8B38|nr:phosphatase PAP2 family protein [Gulosibacter sp. 10]